MRTLDDDHVLLNTVYIKHAPHVWHYKCTYRSMLTDMLKPLVCLALDVHTFLALCRLLDPSSMRTSVLIEEGSLGLPPLSILFLVIGAVCVAV